MLYRKPAEKLTRIMQDYAKIGSSAAADEVVDAFRIAYPEIFDLAQTELQILAVFHDEIVYEVKK